MSDESILKHAGIFRSLTLKLLESIPESQADIIPAGFHNNIRWNFGHIFTVQEYLVFHFATGEAKLPEGFAGWFNKGTSPADWTTTPPTLAELAGYLKEQTGRIQQTFTGRLGEKAAKPFILREGMQFETIGEIINFTLYHEGLHVGGIKGIQRAIEGGK